MRRLLIASGLVLGLWTSALAAYIFDGTDDSIHWGNLPEVSTATNLTCQAWVWNDNLTQDHVILSNMSGSFVGFHFMTRDVGNLHGDTDTYHVQITNSGGSPTAILDGPSGTALANTWQHIMFTAEVGSATGLRIYVDNVESTRGPVSMSALSNLGNSTSNVRIGEANFGTGDRAGRLAEAACWNRIVTAGERTLLSKAMSPSMVLNGLVFYAPLRGIPHNLKGGQAGTVVNNAAATNSHPRLYAGIGSMTIGMAAGGVPPPVVSPCIIGGGVGACIVRLH